MTDTLVCKECAKSVEDITAEALKCAECSQNVHITCLKRGSVPGGFAGDIFFTFTCDQCSQNQQEVFLRERMPWFQAMVLVLFHINAKNPGLARRGYFHWKMHLATVIDKNWDILFPKDFKRKKKWIGTISGTLSHYSPYFFHSGTTIFGEQGWWTLTFPKLTPNTIMKINSEFMAKKPKLKDSLTNFSDFEIVNEIIKSKGYSADLNKSVFENIETPDPITPLEDPVQEDPNIIEVNLEVVKEVKTAKSEKTQKKFLLPTLDTFTECTGRKWMKTNSGARKMQKDTSPQLKNSNEDIVTTAKETENPITFMDPMCHYNTSLNSISLLKGMHIRAKLMGSLREETVLSPYSNLYLKPYIRRDISSVPDWLKLMAEVLITSNRKNTDFVLPTRSTIDYVYVQPSHIPAINSLCNQFFWPGIDLTDCLQYPDFSCVVLYRKLVIGFAFVVPDVKVHENYISFLFVRPGWRNSGIAKFMMYHLIQTSMGRDLTLHVSINNPALFLYQKFGFKVEHVVQNFYEKYYQKNSKESKHAFFCRLER